MFHAYVIRVIDENVLQLGCYAAWVTRYAPLYITGAGLCFNMRLRSKGLDIPRLECMIGPQTQIHVTDFQRLVRELHSAHISPFYIRANQIWLHKAFPPPRGNVLHAGKQMCVRTGWFTCICECMHVFMLLFVLQLMWSKFTKGDVRKTKCCCFLPTASHILCVCVCCLPLWGTIWLLTLAARTSFESGDIFGHLRV